MSENIKAGFLSPTRDSHGVKEKALSQSTSEKDMSNFADHRSVYFIIEGCVYDKRIADVKEMTWLGGGVLKKNFE